MSQGDGALCPLFQCLASTIRQTDGLTDTTGYVKILFAVLYCPVFVRSWGPVTFELTHRWHRKRTELHCPTHVKLELFNDNTGLTARKKWLKELYKHVFLKVRGAFVQLRNKGIEARTGLKTAE